MPVVVVVLLVLLAIGVRLLATWSGLAPRDVAAWPPHAIDTGLAIALVAAIGIVAAIDESSDAGAWSAACPPPDPPAEAPFGSPVWPEADLPVGDDVASLEASTGIRIPQLDGRWPRCTSVTPDPVGGGARIEVRGWSNLGTVALARDAAAALDAARITGRREDRVEAGGRKLFGRTTDGAVRASIAIVPSAAREQRLVTVRVVIGPEFVGACRPVQRRVPCRVLYTATDAARAAFDPPERRSRVEVVSGYRLRLASRYGVDIGPGTAPSQLEAGILERLDYWRRKGKTPCYLPGRLGRGGCSLVSARSEPPRLPYSFAVVRRDRAGIDYRGVIRIERAGQRIDPRIAIDVRFITGDPVR